MLLALLWSPPSFAGDRHGLTWSGYDDAIRAATRKYWGDFPDWRFWKAQLYQESAFDTDAVSASGAAGLCQAMQGTFADWARDLHWGDANPHVAKFCIEGGARYQANLRLAWSANRPAVERHYLGLAAYNAGLGNILAAQTQCRDARLWADIAPCLPLVTGSANARQTTDYVTNIARWRALIP